MSLYVCTICLSLYVSKVLNIWLYMCLKFWNLAKYLQNKILQTTKLYPMVNGEFKCCQSSYVGIVK